MEFVPATELLRKARKGRYAIAALLAHPPNLEHIKSIIAAADEERSAVILQANEDGFAYARLESVVALSKIFAKETSVPITLHLDHGSSFELAAKCIRAGFSSVMYDGSHLPLEENIRVTKEVVRLAHSLGISVEAELGEMPGEWERGKWTGMKQKSHLKPAQISAGMTDPADAARLVDETDVDSLAISVGTTHGARGNIDFQRLESIAKNVDAYLVVHGASGIPEASLKRIIAMGICKLNFWTTLRLGFSKGMKQQLRNRREIYPAQVLEACSLGLRDAVKQCIRSCGSSGKF